jgi:hypothetical protein
VGLIEIKQSQELRERKTWDLFLRRGSRDSKSGIRAQLQKMVATKVLHWDYISMGCTLDFVSDRHLDGLGVKCSLVS